MSVGVANDVSFWTSDEPSYPAGLACVTLEQVDASTESSRDYGWVARDCTQAKNFVCQTGLSLLERFILEASINTSPTHI